MPAVEVTAPGRSVGHSLIHSPGRSLGRSVSDRPCPFGLLKLLLSGPQVDHFMGRSLGRLVSDRLTDRLSSDRLIFLDFFMSYWTMSRSLRGVDHLAAW